MAQWLFPNFLDSSSAYAAAQQFWEACWADVPGTADVEQPWTIQWMKNLKRDGNPIFTAVCRPLRRGVRIIQEEPGDADDVDLDWWLGYFGDKTDRDAISELVIACCPSIENIQQIRKLLSQWVEGGEITLQQAAG